jgi:myo-inositol-1(or 4)-monophosphatase
MDLDYVKRVGIAAAYEGGRVLINHLGKLAHIHKKGRIDLVTEADTGSEKCIKTHIQQVFPDHTILAEESGLAQGDAQYRWIIDPLDGTTNYAHQLGLFAVSIAFALDGEVIIGIVLNPLSGELFVAAQDQGATLNGHTIQVSTTAKVADSLLVTGFPYAQQTIIDELMARFTRCLKASQGVRRLGSAALDLCYVACGRFEGFWEQELQPWDTAAGQLIAREAGATVSDFTGSNFLIEQKEILATNGRIHKEMLALLELKDTQ